MLGGPVQTNVSLFRHVMSSGNIDVGSHDEATPHPNPEEAHILHGTTPQSNRCSNSAEQLCDRKSRVNQHAEIGTNLARHTFTCFRLIFLRSYRAVYLKRCRFSNAFF